MIGPDERPLRDRQIQRGQTKILQMPNMTKPVAMSQRLSILLVRMPMIGMAKIAPRPRGLTAHPAAQRRVAQQLLIEERQQGDQAVKDGAEERDEDTAERKVAMS